MMCYMLASILTDPLSFSYDTVKESDNPMYER